MVTSSRNLKLRFSLSRRYLATALGLIGICSVSWATSDEHENAALTSAETQSIQLGKIYSSTQGASESVSYRFDAEVASTYYYVLEQSGLDFTATLVHPGGLIETFNSPLRRDEREIVLIEPKTSGVHLITIRSEEPTHAVGEYRFSIAYLPRGTPESYRMQEGLRLMASAASAYDQEDRDSQLIALATYRDASAVWRELGRQRELAQSLYCEAMLEYWAAYDWARSAAIAEESAKIYKTLGLERLFANTTLLQGVALIEAANEMEQKEATRVFEDALELLESAAEIHQATGNEYDFTVVTNNLGLTRFYMGEWDLARSLWREAAEQFKDLGEWREELNARQNVAVVDGVRGYNKRAIESLQYIVDALPPGSDPQFRVNVLDNLAANQRRYGDFEEALRNYTAARALHERLGDGIGEAYSLNGIGNVYFSVGELDLAERHLRQALALAQAANDGRAQESILSRLGDIKYGQSEFTQALELHEAAAALATGDAVRARRQLPIARDLAALSRYEEALRLAAEAVDLAKKAQAPAAQADALMQLGRIELALNKPASAKPHFESALAAYRSLGLKVGQADAYDGLAMTLRAEGRLDEAIQYGRSTLDLNESLRAQVASPELRALYSAESRRYFENLIEMQIAKAETEPFGKDAHHLGALTTSENARARLTIDLLKSASVNLRSRADPELLAEERSLLEELSALSQQRDRLLRRPVSDAETEMKLADLDALMTNIESRLHVLNAAVHRSDPAYASMSRSTTMTATEIQQALDEDTVLLQFSIGDRHSYAWAVTQDSIKTISFARQSEIQDLSLKIIEQLRTPTARPEARRQLDDDLQALAQQVIHPFTDILADKRRMLVAPEAALEYIPFGVLPLSAKANAPSLVEVLEIVTVPSMTVITALRSRGEVADGTDLAIFADPVLDKADLRLTDETVAANAAIALPEMTLTRAAENLKRLPSTGVEARSIASLLPNENVYLALGFEASREQVLSMDLKPFRYLHFATHGTVDAQYPALSSLAMARYGPDGADRDGALRLFEIFDLDLNAQVVVLSACETALGKQIRGEGLIGLAQGFLYAGSKSLVASLWQVSDRATAELMTRFYGYMLDEEHPLPPAAALRDAQIAMAKSRRWSHPFYWSAFVLLGDWQ